MKTVQELLRHANSRITLEVYTQAITSHQRAAQTKVVRMMVPDLAERKDESHPQLRRLGAYCTDIKPATSAFLGVSWP